MTLADGIFGEPFVKLNPTFTTQTGINVNHVPLGYDAAVQKQTAAFAAQSDAYDVVQIDYLFQQGYASAGHLEPLQGLIDGSALSQYTADVPKSFIDMYSYKGELFGLATIANCQSFTYNAAHLQDAGLSVPDTWADVLTTAQKVVNPSKNRYGFTAGMEKLAKAFAVWLPIFWANGGVVFDDKYQPQLNSQIGLDALLFLLELVKTMPPGGAAYTESDEVTSLAKGLTTLDPVIWIPDPFTTADPSIKPQLMSRVDPMGSARRAPTMGGLGLVVSHYSKNKPAAAEYVRWFNSPDVQANMIVQNGGQPALNSAWAANKDKEPWFGALADNLKIAIVEPELPEFGDVDSAVGTQMARAFAGEVTPKQALDQAQTDVEKIVRDAGYLK
jgi:multiple sugar transport system substrate-binding protein